MAANLSLVNSLLINPISRMDTGPFTIAAWIKTTQATSNVCFLSRTGTPSSNRGFTDLMNNSAGKMGIHAKDSGGTYRTSFNGAVTVNDGVWRHLGLVHNMSTTANGNKVYIDGTLDAQGTSSAAWDMLTTADFRIGNSVDTFWGDYGDNIAEVAWFDAELIAAEIAALAKGFSPQRVKLANLVAYCPLIRTDREKMGRTTSGTVFGHGVDPHTRVYGVAA